VLEDELDEEEGTEDDVGTGDCPVDGAAEEDAPGEDELEGCGPTLDEGPSGLCGLEAVEAGEDEFGGIGVAEELHRRNFSYLGAMCTFNLLTLVKSLL
jgi:hypothetical protein